MFLYKNVNNNVHIQKIVPVTGTILQSFIRFSAERPLNPEPDEQAEQYGERLQGKPQMRPSEIGHR